MLYVFVRYLRLFLKEFRILPDLVCSHQREMKRVDDSDNESTQMEIAPCSELQGAIVPQSAMLTLSEAQQR